MVNYHYSGHIEHLAVFKLGKVAAFAALWSSTAWYEFRPKHLHLADIPNELAYKGEAWKGCSLRAHSESFCNPLH